MGIILAYNEFGTTTDDKLLLGVREYQAFYLSL